MPRTANAEPKRLTNMQLAAMAVAHLPRAEAARRLGLKTPQAVAMRIRRATAPSAAAEAARGRLSRPRAGKILACDPSTIDFSETKGS